MTHSRRCEPSRMLCRAVAGLVLAASCARSSSRSDAGRTLNPAVSASASSPGNASSPGQALDEVWEEWGASVGVADRLAIAPDGTVYVEEIESGRVRCLSPETGHTRWVRSFPAPLERGLATSFGYLHAETTKGRTVLAALRADTGEPLWRYPGVWWAADIGKRTTVLFGQAPDLLALDSETGAERWRASVASTCSPTSNRQTEVRGRGGKALVSSRCSEDRAPFPTHWAMLDGANGKRLWQMDQSAQLFWVADDQLYADTPDGFFRVDVATGTLRDRSPPGIELAHALGRAELNGVDAGGTRYFFKAGFTNFPGAPSEPSQWYSAAPGATRASALLGSPGTEVLLSEHEAPHLQQGFVRLGDLATALVEQSGSVRMIRTRRGSLTPDQAFAAKPRAPRP